ncbi:MAG: PrsW family glutamic-type intramembrane protease, partial [Anaerolineae bacterium]
MTNTLNRQTKWIITLAGGLLALPGLPLLLFGFCAVLALMVENDPEAVNVGLGMATFLAVTVGCGGLAFWHGYASIRGQPSRPLRLPLWGLAGGFVLALALGWAVWQGEVALGLFFPPLLLASAGLGPILALVWFSGEHPGGLTWRRGLVAMAGGATLGAGLALILGILLPWIVLVLVAGLAETVLDGLRPLLDALAGRQVREAIDSPVFIFFFIQIALIAPLTEELAKPLVTLPLLRYLSRRDAFLLGAAAGVGFAALENLLYAAFGLGFWGGILAVRAVGAAIHPLGSGLVAVGWRDVLQGKDNAWGTWFRNYGLAVLVHALWNGGSLIVLTLAAAEFFGELPPEVDVLGVSMGGTTLAILLVLGLGALVAGREVARRLSPAPATGEQLVAAGAPSDRAIAIWGLLCLAAVVPMGIAALQLLI